MITTGQELKNRLHLSSFKYVKIRRVITGGSEKCYQIVFDSRNPSRPLTTFILQSILLPRVYDGNSEKYSCLPWSSIEIFNGILNPGLYFVSDVSGFYGKPERYSENFSCQNKLDELTIQDLRNYDAYTSNLTQKYKDIRTSFQGQSVKNTKLLDTQVIEETGSLRFVFLTEATETKGKKTTSHFVAGEVKTAFDREEDKLVDNPSNTYDMYLQLENVFPNSFYKGLSWLEVYNGEEVNEKMMKDLLEVCDVKIWDSTPAMQYQGFLYRLSQVDSAIYKETRPDTFWRKKHGSQALLDKHFSQLFTDMGMFLNLMLSSFIKVCRKQDYASNTGKDNKLVINIKEK